MRLLIFQPLLALAMIPFTVMSPIDSSSAVEVPGHSKFTTRSSDHFANLPR